MVDFSDGNAVTVDNADGSTTVYFDNQFEKIPGWLTIRKPTEHYQEAGWQ